VPQIKRPDARFAIFRSRSKIKQIKNKHFSLRNNFCGILVQKLSHQDTKGRLFGVTKVFSTIETIDLTIIFVVTSGFGHGLNDNQGLFNCSVIIVAKNNLEGKNVLWFYCLKKDTYLIKIEGRNWVQRLCVNVSCLWRN
jgi:hypothetical protein